MNQEHDQHRDHKPGQQPPPRRPRVVDPSAVREAWREGEDLVMHATKARLPNYCVVTGEAVGNFRTTEELAFLSLKGRLLGAPLGLTDLFVKRYPVQLPVSGKALRAAKKFRWPGRLIMALGVVGVAGGAILIQMALAKSPRLGGLPSSLPVLTLLGGVLALFAGGFLARSGMLPLRIVEVHGQYIKIRGAHLEFLKTLQPVRPE